MFLNKTSLPFNYAESVQQIDGRLNKSRERKTYEKPSAPLYVALLKESVKAECAETDYYLRYLTAADRYMLSFCLLNSIPLIPEYENDGEYKKIGNVALAGFYMENGLRAYGWKPLAEGLKARKWRDYQEFLSHLDAEARARHEASGLGLKRDELEEFIRFPPGKPPAGSAYPQKPKTDKKAVDKTEKSAPASNSVRSKRKRSRKAEAEHEQAMARILAEKV